VGGRERSILPDGGDVLLQRFILLLQRVLIVLMTVELLAHVFEDVLQLTLACLGFERSEDVLLPEENVPPKVVQGLERVLAKYFLDDVVPYLIALFYLVKHGQVVGCRR